MAVKGFENNDDPKIFFSENIQELSSKINFYCSEPVLFIPSFMAFYEFVMYALPVISAYSICQHKSLKILFFPSIKLTKDFVKALNLDVLYYKPEFLYFFEKIYFYNDYMNSKNLINNNSYKLFQSLSDPIYSNNNSRIFLIRKKGICRHLINREELINISRKYDFKVISPEVDFSDFVEQASFFKNCEYFICEGGSGLCNFFLTPRKCKILTLHSNYKPVITLSRALNKIMNDTGHSLNYCEGNLITESAAKHSWILCPKKFEESIKLLLK